MQILLTAWIVAQAASPNPPRGMFMFQESVMRQLDSLLSYRQNNFYGLSLLRILGICIFCDYRVVVVLCVCAHL